VALVLLAATVALADGRARAQSSFASPCDIRTSERVVAIGDVHGAYDRFAGILRTAGLVDGRERWSGGRAVLVQTGDVLDRGPDSRRALDLLRRLEREAVRAGGRVYALLGNHEVMRMIWDWRYVSAEEIAAFRTGTSAELRERTFGVIAAAQAQQARAENRPFDEAALRESFMRDIVLGFIEMRQAFHASGEYGRWLREHTAVVKINGILFVHGGIDAATAKLGCEGIIERVRGDMAVPDPTPAQSASMFSMSENGPLWYRGLALEPEPAFAPALAGILTDLGARAIVVGHTVTGDGRIQPRFGGRVIQIDTGMLGGEWYPGGSTSALEIRGDALTAIYQDKRAPLVVPALAAAGTTR
jgi:hypothetical protein